MVSTLNRERLLKLAGILEESASCGHLNLTFEFEGDGARLVLVPHGNDLVEIEIKSVRACLEGKLDSFEVEVGH